MLKFGNTYLNYNGTYLSGFKVPTYNVILQQNEGGVIGALPLSGYRNSEVTLSNTPNQNYVFNGYEISGSNLYDTNKFKFVDSDVTAMAKWTYDWPDPNPLNLPTNTMRVKCYPGNILYPDTTAAGYTVTKVGEEGDSSIYDIVTRNNTWECLAIILSVAHSNTASYWGVSDILGVNNSEISSMCWMFAGGAGSPHYAFSDLSSICYFDTSNVVDMRGVFTHNETIRIGNLPRFNTSSVKSFREAFKNSNVNKPLTLDCLSCSSLAYTFRESYSHVSGFPVLHNTQNVEDWSYTFAAFALLPELANRNLTIPDYDYSKATNVSGMFLNNPYVSGGISSTFAKLSALGNQITAHSACFWNCGVSSEQGRAELALIPSDWK